MPKRQQQMGGSSGSEGIRINCGSSLPFDERTAIPINSPEEFAKYFDMNKARNIFAQQKAMALQAEERNSQPPSTPPRMDPAFIRRNFDMQYAKKEAEKRANFGQTPFGFRSAYINGKVHCSKKPLDELKPIHLGQMQVPMVHQGRVLACRLITEAMTTIGTDVLFEDTRGQVQKLVFYNFNTNLCDSSWLAPGIIVFIKEPYMKYSSLGPGWLVRVESPSDAIFVHKSNRELLELADAMCWYEPERLTAEELKKRGNQAFQQYKFDDALHHYERALLAVANNNTNGSDHNELTAMVPVLHLNMAAALLELGQYSNATAQVKKALALGGEGGTINKEKAHFRLGRAAYGMRQWAEAVEQFQTALAMNPANNHAKEELERAKSRLHESKTGKYDIRKMFDDTKGGGDFCNMDVADYTGPVKMVNIEGRGKGLILTADASKGTLLIASKAYSTGYTPMEFTVNVLNLVTNEMCGADTLLCVIQTVQRLKREPETARDLYGLYGGEGSDADREEMPPEGVIDTGRIERICGKNCIRLPTELDACGLWILPSFLNHSCLGNTINTLYGDMMFITALYDLKQGTELTTAYNSFLPDESLEERSALFTKKWGFHCDCRLCELDRKERDQERKRVEMVKEYTEVIKPKIVSEPTPKNVQLLMGLVERMRRTYGQRKEHRYQMFGPLMGVATVHESFGQWKTALDAYQELLDVLGPYKQHLPNIYEKIAKIYANGMGNKTMAKRTAYKAFEMVKQKLDAFGHVDKELFLHMHPAFAPYMRG